MYLSGTRASLVALGIYVFPKTVFTTVSVDAVAAIKTDSALQVEKEAPCEGTWQAVLDTDTAEINVTQGIGTCHSTQATEQTKLVESEKDISCGAFLSGARIARTGKKEIGRQEYPGATWLSVVFDNSHWGEQNGSDIVW